MVAAVFLMLGLGVWLVDSAVRGRSPIVAIKQLISSGDLSTIDDTIDTSNPYPIIPNGINAGHYTGDPKSPNSPVQDVINKNNNSSNTPPATNYPGTVTQWVDEAAMILAANGRPLTNSEKDALVRYYIPYESSGNPKAINLWDKNAKNGIPSKGLMQTITPTFNAHALPGYTDIWNPVDNIIAAVRYIDGRYGSIFKTPGMISIANGGKWKGY